MASKVENNTITSQKEEEMKPQEEEEMKTQEEEEEEEDMAEESHGEDEPNKDETNQDSKMEEEQETQNIENENKNPSFAAAAKPSIEGASPGKIFVGGLPKDTTDEAFTKHFGKYGKIVDSVIMKHRDTGHPRGFGFITYEDANVVDAVILDTHTFQGKQVEIKRTIPKGAISGRDFQTKKIFVGGIPASVDEEEFKNFFSKFGEVEENLLMRDHITGRSRGFGFISFSSEKAVDDLLIKGNRIEFAGAQVEIRKAEPKKAGGAPSFAPPAKQYSNPKPSFGRGRGRGGLKDPYGGGMGTGPYRYGGRFGSNRAAGYAGANAGAYAGSEFDSGYGGAYPNTSMGSYRGDASLGYSSRYGSGLGRGYGYSDPSDGYYGSYGGGASGGGYGGGASGGGYGGASGGGYGGASGGGYGGAGDYGGAGGYGGGAGMYNARRDFGSGGASGRYHPYGR